MRGRYSVVIFALFSWHGCGDSGVEVENTPKVEGANTSKLCEWIPAKSACSYSECTYSAEVAKGRIAFADGECSVVDTEEFPIHLCTWTYEPDEPIRAVTNIGRALFYRGTSEGYEFAFRGPDIRLVRENHGYTNEWVYCGDVTVINKPAECGLCPNTLPN